MEKSYLVSAKRTPVGSFLGSFKDMGPVELAAFAVRAALEKAGVPPEDVHEVIFGQVLTAGRGQGTARQIAIKSGLPESICGYGINMVCGSGLKSVMQAAVNIRAGIGSLYLAGGAESMSQAPFLMPGELRGGQKMGEVKFADHMILDGLTDAFENYHMGVTAENIAERFQISREAQDAFAFRSQEKAIAAVDAGLFDEEIVPVEVPSRKETILVSRDEYPNRGSSLEKLAKLRPAFKKDGSVTAGNASGLNDGAAAVVVASESYCQAHQLRPMAEIIAVGQGGVDPSVMGLGPVPAVRAALKMAGMTLAEMDVLELNEAFAAQSLGVQHELKAEHGVDDSFFDERCNIRGGAIALGHPIGASGARILVTLAHILKQEGKRYGLASLCIGGGMGTCVILRNTEL